MAGDAWIECTVDAIKSAKPNALATGPFGSAISSRYFVDKGVPVIRGSNLSQDVGIRLIDDGLAFLAEDKAGEFSRSLAKRGDLVFTCWGTIDQVGLVDERSRFPEYIVSNKQMKLTPNPLKADSLYLYYLFASPLMRERILNQGIGSSVPGFNLGQLRALTIALPPVREQRAIARILGTLDDTIELNRRVIETLEAMARAIFKSWFVDFDPVRAKVEGRDPGLPKHLADLFPDSFEDSELGEIPKGWEVKALGELLELAYGKALKADNRQLGTVPVYGSNGQVGWHDEKLVTGPGIIVGRKGTPGVVKWVPTDFFPIDTTFYVVPKDRCGSLHFLFYVLKLQDLGSLGADSAVPGLNRNLAYMSKQIVPSGPDLVFDAFDSFAQPLFERIYEAENESRTLAALRDVLLPKLISGEKKVTLRSTADED